MSYDVTASDKAPLQPVAFTPKYGVSRPRSTVLLDGLPYTPVLWRITFNAHGATDEATVVVPVRGNPDFTVQLFRGTPPTIASGTGPIWASSATPAGLAAATDDSPVYAEIYAGFPPNPLPNNASTAGLVRRFLGVVDRYSVRFNGGEVTFKLRSLAAPLVDDKITIAATNMTARQFVSLMATKYGLPNPHFQIGGGGDGVTIAETFSREFAVGIRRLSPFDVMQQTAQFDDADVWVDAMTGTLNYVSPSLLTRTTVALTYGRDVSLSDDCDGDHAPQYNKNISVVVRSFNPRVRTSHSTKVATDPMTGGVTVSQTVRQVTSTPVFGTNESVSESISKDGSVTVSSSATTGGSVSAKTGEASESGKETYVFYYPNISQASALNAARAKWRQISMHEYSLAFSIPVTQTLLGQVSISSKLQVSGLSYQFFNDTFWPREIEEHFDPKSGGWKWHIRAVNHTPPPGGGV